MDVEMIDTLCLKHFFAKPIDMDTLRNRGAIPINTRRNTTWAINPPKGELKPRITVIGTPDGLTHVYAQTSLPGLLFGHNVRLPSEAEALSGATQIAEYTEEVTGLSFPVESATVSEIHYTRNLQIGAAAAIAPLRLYNRSLPRLKKRLFENTLYFQNQGTTIRVYDKFAEVLSKNTDSKEALDLARGVLRIEYAAKQKGVKSLVKRYELAGQNPSSLISEQMSNQILDRLMSDLDFHLLDSDSDTLDLLRSKYSLSKAWRLSGFLGTVENQGERFYLDPTFGFSKQEYQRALRDCKRAGAYPIVLDNNGTLDVRTWHLGKAHFQQVATKKEDSRA